MAESKTSNKVTWGISALILLLTLLTMFPLELGMLRRGSEFAVQIMAGLLLLGLTFMVFRKERLMFVSLACSAALCIFLKNASNENFIFPERKNLPTLSIVHINLSSLENNYEELIKLVAKYKPDIISFQELTPDWDLLLKRTLGTEYPAKYAMVRIDPYGMGIYSKLPLNKVDTFQYQNVPNLKSELNFDDGKVAVISSYIIPSPNNSARQKNRNHLTLLSNKVSNIKAPVIALGDYNLVYWSDEIRAFRESTGLLNSRRNISLSKFEIPFDHIFYSPQLECIGFEEIETKEFSHVGIYGEYQLKSNPQVADSK